MRAAARLHARERQLQRHDELAPKVDDVGLFNARKGRLDTYRRAQSRGERVRHGVEKLRGRIGKWIAGKGPDKNAGEAPARHEDGCLRQQDDVAAFDVDVLVRRVVCGPRIAQ